MSKKPSIQSQIEAANAAFANERFDELSQLIEQLLERRLNAQQEQRVAELVDLLAEASSVYRMADQLNKYRSRYQLSIAASGAKSLNNGDDVAQALEAKSAIEVMALADQLLGAPKGFASHAARYEKLNEGQKRMNSGNKLRAAVKRGDLVVEDGVFIAA